MVAAALLGSSALYAAPAAAQATRTWVSGVGDDVNPCSRTAPCKTFAGAISKTAAGGEINCLDPAGFGGVTITKAMTIICDFTEGGVLVASGPGITINAGDNDVVTLSGLDLFGPTTFPGSNGINFVNGAGLNLRNTTIKGFSTQAINFTPGAGDTSFLYIDNVKILGNGTVGNGTTGAIKIAPASNATANVVISNTQVQGNQNVGVRVDFTGVTAAKANVTVSNSSIDNSGAGMLLKATAGTGTILATVSDSVISGNTNVGVVGNGPGVNVRVTRTVITQNGSASAAAATGVQANNTAAVISYGTNVLAGNLNSAGTASDGAFSSTVTQN